jgi:hypothetical protein
MRRGDETVLPEGQAEAEATEAGTKRRQPWAPEPERRQPAAVRDLAELRMMNRNRRGAGSDQLQQSSRLRAAVRGEGVGAVVVSAD